MAKLVSSAKRSYDFVSEKLWKVRINKVDKRQGFFIRQLRVFSLAIKGFDQDNCLVSATALTFYTLFSIVPILALIFAIAKGFGYEKTLQDQILANYEQYKDILQNAFVYANVMLSNTSEGIIAGFGIVLLLWSVMKLLINVENSFNGIWEVTRGRSWIRKITDYLTIMLVGPLLLIISGGLTVALQTKIDSFTLLGPLGVILIKTVAYLFVVGVFTFLYIALPNIKVSRKAAVSAAFISAFLFELVGWAYVNFQIGANQLNAIYGGFAALPLFLIWVQYSWYIVLFGAELAYGYQNVHHHELETEIQNISVRYKKIIALMIMNLITKRFYARESALTAQAISDKLDLPARLTRTLLNDFVETGVLVEVRAEADETTYQPGVTESKLTVQFVLDSLEKKGINSLPINDSAELSNSAQLMQEMENILDTRYGKVFVKDIVT